VGVHAARSGLRPQAIGPLQQLSPAALCLAPRGLLCAEPRRLPLAKRGRLAGKLDIQLLNQGLLPRKLLLLEAHLRAEVQRPTGHLLRAAALTPSLTRRRTCLRTHRRSGLERQHGRSELADLAGPTVEFLLQPRQLLGAAIPDRPPLGLRSPQTLQAPEAPLCLDAALRGQGLLLRHGRIDARGLRLLACQALQLFDMARLQPLQLQGFLRTEYLQMCPPVRPCGTHGRPGRCAALAAWQTLGARRASGRLRLPKDLQQQAFGDPECLGAAP